MRLKLKNEHTGSIENRTLNEIGRTVIAAYKIVMDGYLYVDFLFSDGDCCLVHSNAAPIITNERHLGDFDWVQLPVIRNADTVIDLTDCVNVISQTQQERPTGTTENHSWFGEGSQPPYTRPYTPADATIARHDDGHIEIQIPDPWC